LQADYISPRKETNLQDPVFLRSSQQSLKMPSLSGFDDFRCPSYCTLEHSGDNLISVSPKKFGEQGENILGDCPLDVDMRGQETVHLCQESSRSDHLQKDGSVAERNK
jgi:hypothetical protein